MQNFYLQIDRSLTQKTEAVTLSKEYLSPLSLCVTVAPAFHVTHSQIKRTVLNGAYDSSTRHLFNLPLRPLFTWVIKWCTKCLKVTMSHSSHNKLELSLLFASHGEDNDAALTSCRYEIATIHFNYCSKGHSEQTDSVHSTGITKAD